MGKDCDGEGCFTIGTFILAIFIASFLGMCSSHESTVENRLDRIEDKLDILVPVGPKETE